MSEHKRIKINELMRLNGAAEEMGLPDVSCLKMTREGIILINYPMTFSILPLQKEGKKIEKIRNLVLNLKNNINIVVSDQTPFRDTSKKNFAFVRNHMQNAFFNMMELAGDVPGLEIDMPEGIVDIKPGFFVNYSKTLNNGSIYLGKKYIPPRIETLGDKFNIDFIIKPPQSAKIYQHTIPYEFKK